MINPWFVTGFCEGEGAFTYSRSGKNLNLYFAIKLNDKDDALLVHICDFFNVGKIYRVKSRSPGNRSGDTKPAVYYRVTKISELTRVVEHFDKYPLQGKKAGVYKIWKEMWLLKSRFRKPDLSGLNILAIKLSGLSSKNSRIRIK